jgi:murein L,D-transpeptidase YafK
MVLLAVFGLTSCVAAPAEVAQQPAVPVPAAAQVGSNRMAESSWREVPTHADFVLVDKSDRLLVVYREGQAIRAYRGIQFGAAPFGHKRFEGDERTPEGRYSIDTRNPQSAFHLSLRVSYPNDSDRAFAASYGRSPGGDIFIHGQPNALASGRMRGDWTDGCIALTNAEIEELWQIVPDGTPIEIRQ